MKNMQKVAVIGAGISGLAAAHLLEDRYDVTVFEKESNPGGLIRCKRINGSLFHICGGHVFNSKRKDVLDWFWRYFDRDRDFVKTDRNAIVFMENGYKIPYPIENHVYKFDADFQKSFINDLLNINSEKEQIQNNFEEFLCNRFGNTLYETYFKPYNEKVWRRDLKTVPLSWLEGKLPMPTVAEMIFNNINHIEEKSFVHSSFWYEKKNGSQFIVDRLSQGLNIHLGCNISSLVYENKVWKINGESYDKVIFCGNIKQLPSLLGNVDISNYSDKIRDLEYHGTTSVFCEIEKNPYSWIYMPSRLYNSHRIICTGNFSKTNDEILKMTGTVEFTDEISIEDIEKELKKIPLSPHYLAHHYSKYTYPIQDAGTRNMIVSLKLELSPYNFFMTGRFADWEYYNMDVAIGAAMDLCEKI